MSQQPSRRLPSLLAGINPSLLQGESSSDVIPPRPRALWTVQDASLRPLPPLAVLNPRYSTYVSDAPPSVVAIRIAECLRLWSTCAEYDADNATANVLCVDRTLLNIQLYKGKKTVRADYSHGTIVECTRVQGNTMTATRLCSAILAASVSESNGKDTRSLCMNSARDWMRLYSDTMPPRAQRLLPMSTDQKLWKLSGRPEALEDALSLLNKDRLDAQVLGMERLVALTDPTVSGMETAAWTGQACLLDSDAVYQYLARLVLRHDDMDAALEKISSSESVLSVLCPSPVGATTSLLDPAENMAHRGNLRSMALRVVANSLWTLKKDRPGVLGHILSGTTVWASSEVLDVLLQDLQHGPSRPPSIVLQGMAGPHECVFILRILRVLALQLARVRESLKDYAGLAHCRALGAASHVHLEEEARAVCNLTTEEERSC